MTFVEMIQFALLDVFCHVTMGYMMVIFLSSRDTRKKDEEDKR